VVTDGQQTMTPLTHFSLFSGIGGLDLAAEWAGFRTVGQVEYANYPFRVLRRRFGRLPRWRDIKDVTGEAIIERCGVPTIISGGFPCRATRSRAAKASREHLVHERDRWGRTRPKSFAKLGRDGLWATTSQGTVPVSHGRYLLERAQRVTLAPKWGILSGGGSCGGCRRRRAAPPGTARCSLGPTPRTSDTRSGRIVEVNENGSLCRVNRDRTQTSGANLADAVRMWPTSPSERLQECDPSSCGRATRLYPWCSDPLGNLWLSEPLVGRVADGVPSRVDRLRCLGNAVVPQQAFPIFQAIAAIEMGAIA
jgi:DNA (cytosine-5)-methyltransferase 1